MMGVCVDMSDHWVAAESIGDMRQQENERARRVDLRSKHSDNPGSLHRQGAIGELAVSMWTGLPWTGLLFEGANFESFRSLGAPDVGTHIQVRTRPNLRWDLPVYKKDRSDHIFVLALLDNPRVWLRGWTLGALAKQPQYWASFLPRPNYLVPQEDLFVMDLLNARTA